MALFFMVQIRLEGDAQGKGRVDLIGQVQAVAQTRSHEAVVVEGTVAIDAAHIQEGKPFRIGLGRDSVFQIQGVAPHAVHATDIELVR